MHVRGNWDLLSLITFTHSEVNDTQKIPTAMKLLNVLMYIKNNSLTALTTLNSNSQFNTLKVQRLMDLMLSVSEELASSIRHIKKAILYEEVSTPCRHFTICLNEQIGAASVIQARQSACLHLLVP